MYFIVHVSGGLGVWAAALRRNNVLCRFCVECAVCPGAVCPLSVCRNLKNWNATSDDCKWRREHEERHFTFRSVDRWNCVRRFLPTGQWYLQQTPCRLVGLRAQMKRAKQILKMDKSPPFHFRIWISHSIPIRFCEIDDEKKYEIWINARFKCKRDANMIECAFPRIRCSNACETVFTLGPITAEKRRQQYLRWAVLNWLHSRRSVEAKTHKKFANEF